MNSNWVVMLRAKQMKTRPRRSSLVGRLNQRIAAAKDAPVDICGRVRVRLPHVGVDRDALVRRVRSEGGGGIKQRLVVRQVEAGAEVS